VAGRRTGPKLRFVKWQKPKERALTGKKKSGERNQGGQTNARELFCRGLLPVSIGKIGSLGDSKKTKAVLRKTRVSSRLGRARVCQKGNNAPFKKKKTLEADSG